MFSDNTYVYLYVLTELNFFYHFPKTEINLQ
jgi:hypothetical protein